MSTPVLEWILLALTLSVAFNFYLTLRLVRIVGDREYKRLPMTPPIGAPLPAFDGRTAVGNRRIRTSTLAGQSSVLLFFSPGCDKCKVRIAEVVAMYSAIRRSGVNLWVVGSLSRKATIEFLKDTPLLEHALLVGAAAFRKLNPHGSAPFYLFADDATILVAGNLIGDEDWISFCDQLAETEVQPEADAQAATEHGQAAA